MEENAPANDFGLQVVRCYDNSDVIATLITTIFIFI